MSRRRWSTISVLLAALCWELGVRLVPLPLRHYIFTLSEMIVEFPSLWRQHLYVDIQATLTRALGGFAIASVLGIGIGVLIGRSKVALNMVLPIVDFLRPLPSSALIPMVVLIPLLGLSERSYLLIVAYGSLWPVLFGTIIGVKDVNATADAVSRMLPWKKSERLRRFVLPEAAPEIFTGLKVSLGISLILAITAELMMGGGGLGSLLLNLGNASDYRGMNSTILVIAFVGWTLNSLFGLIERRHPWLAWTVSEERGQ